MLWLSILFIGWIKFSISYNTFLQTSHSCGCFSLSCTWEMCCWTFLTTWMNIDKLNRWKKYLMSLIAESLYLSTLRTLWLESRLVSGMDKLDMGLHVIFPFESLGIKNVWVKMWRKKTYENACSTMSHCGHSNNGRSSVWTCWMCWAKNLTIWVNIYCYQEKVYLQLWFDFLYLLPPSSSFFSLPSGIGRQWGYWRRE